MSVVRQMVMNVYGINKVPVSPIYQDAFQATCKFSPDTLIGVPSVNSRVEYRENGRVMLAYVAETVTQIEVILNAGGAQGDSVKWDDGDSLVWDDGDVVAPE